MNATDADNLYRRLFAEREFQVLLSFRHEWFNVREYEEAGAFVHRVLALTGQELR
jgi:hypothetical protein